MELFGKYEVGRLLGCGAFAKVYYGRNIKNGLSVAIKVINKKKIGLGATNQHQQVMHNNIKREISIMRRLQHPHIIRLYEVLASKTKIYFILEFVKGGELFAKVAKGRFSEDLARKYFHQLISAVGYCHSRGVFHRDLKPENLLLDEDGNLKVSDFGLSASCNNNSNSSSMLSTLCGTPAYVAPEILAKKGYNGSKVDVWSCGVVLFVLTAGYLPFNDPNLMSMYKKIYKGEFKCPKWMSSDLRRLLSRLLDTNLSTRITIHQIISDPWFTKHQTQAQAFSFYDDYDYFDYNNEDQKEEEEQITNINDHHGSTTIPLNAFDLISFSSGLDLSGLLDQSFNPIVDEDRFVSAEPAAKILDTMQQVSTTANVGLKLIRKKACWDVDLQLRRPNANVNGNFIVNVQIKPLTQQLVVVEVIKRIGDSASFYEIWKNKVRPLLSHLVHHSQTDFSPSPSHNNTNNNDDDGN